MRRLADLFGSPVALRRTNGWFTIGWVVMIPVVLVTGLKTSIPFLVAINVWALVASHWSGWQSARVEVRQEVEDVPGDVVTAIVENTTVEVLEENK